MSLTTLQAVKAFKDVQGTSHDSELQRLLLAVDRFIENFCGRKLEQATLTEYYHPRAGQSHLLLNRFPVSSITALYDDPLRGFGEDTLVAASDYALEDAEGGILRLLDGEFSGGVRTVKITYVGGYNPVPGDLEQAAIELCWLARDKGDKALLGLQSKSIADGSVTTFKVDWPAGVEDILKSYRRRDRL